MLENWEKPKTTERDMSIGDWWDTSCCQVFEEELIIHESKINPEFWHQGMDVSQVKIKQGSWAHDSYSLISSFMGL